ncbi:DUF2724 domain-containing protein [Escherichia coli]|nr:DUF2724 domain-containing protein [Escherichia coli]
MLTKEPSFASLLVKQSPACVTARSPLWREKRQTAAGAQTAQ